jgi:hypothetical protein
MLNHQSNPPFAIDKIIHTSYLAQISVLQNMPLTTEKERLDAAFALGAAHMSSFYASLLDKQGAASFDPIQHLSFLIGQQLETITERELGISIKDYRSAMQKELEKEAADAKAASKPQGINLPPSARN